MKTNSSIFITFLVCLLAFTGCSKKNADQQNNGNGGTAASSVPEVTSVERRGDNAPNFSWKDATGKTVSMNDLSGKVNVINFWATWCGPCKHELPDLIELQKEYGPKGVRLIGISADVGSNVAADVASFVQEHGINYEVVIANDDLKEAFGNVNALPTTFITDKDGKILSKLVGARKKADFAEAINAHLQ